MSDRSQVRKSGVESQRTEVWGQVRADRSLESGGR